VPDANTDERPTVPPTRIVSLVLVSAEGDVLGRLPAFPVETPWWQDAGPVVAGVRERFGLDVTILRLLDTELPSAHGGAVTYLAEADPARVAASGRGGHFEARDGVLTDDPRRLPYARPGGPAADLAWADAVLAGMDLRRRGPAEQVRTWNLSSLWRLPLSDGAAWLKVVPPFFGHEGAVIERLDGEAVPRLLGHDRERLLFAEIPGNDRYDAARSELLEMVDILVDLQQRWSTRIEELIDIGLPDWRAPALGRAIADVVERAREDMATDDLILLDRFVQELPDRFETIEALGLPDGLVHGDFHPGNVRGSPGRLVLLDWGDSGIGHPLLDQPAFLSRIEPADVAAVRLHWHDAWRRAAPGSDPDRASDLLAPVAAARQAVIYRRFLDNIEPSEHAYHQADVPDWLRRTAAIVRRST
jgi:Ser/Thr protein kinase RdoA (MazF antagonist)